MQLPEDWLTASLPHQVYSYRVGLFGRVTVYTCSCGVFARGKIETLWQAHVLAEQEMKRWMDSIYQKRKNFSKKSGKYWE